MIPLNRPSLALAASLSLLAGYVDSIGFLQLGGYFVSFMSGNTTRLAVALETGDWFAVRLLGLIIAGFVLGAMLGALIGHYAGARRRLGILAYVACLLALAAGLAENGLTLPSALLMVLAMGGVNALFQKNDMTVIGLTYMTGTLVRIGQKMASLITGSGRTDLLPHALLWLGLMSGGIAGAVAYAQMGMHALWPGVILAAVLSMASLHHRDENKPAL